MAELEVLLFDVDGTLADTEKDGHRVAFNLAFKDAGLSWDWSVAMYADLLAVTGGKERMKYYLEHFNKDYAAPDDLDGFVAGLHKEKTAHYTRMLAEGAIALRPGVRRLIAEARAAGLRMGISTTTTPANVTALLTNSLGVDSESWFEVIAAGDVVPAKKPAPDIYDYAMEQMGVTPEQCLAFEDSENGIRSSVGAKLTTLVTINDYTRDHSFDGAAIVLDQLGEPGAPFKVLEGDAGGHDMVNLAMLKEVHARAWSA